MPPDETRTGGPARKSETHSPLQPLRGIQGQGQPLRRALAASELSPGTKPDQIPEDQRVTQVPSILRTVEHQTLIAEQAPPSASSAIVSASANSDVSHSAIVGSANANMNTSANATVGGASATVGGTNATVGGANATVGGANATVGGANATPTPHVGVPARSSRPARPESPLAHARRGVGPNHVPPARIETVTCPAGPECYKLSITLPRPGGAALATEMITVSARRGGRLAVVADAWHLERDCE